MLVVPIGDGGPVQTLATVGLLLAVEHVLVELLLQALIREVDA